MSSIVNNVASFALATTKYVASVATPVVVAVATASVAVASYAPTVVQGVAFPYVVNSVSGTSTTANTTTFTLLTSAAPISGAGAGDMLVAVFSNDGNATVTIDTAFSGNNWTALTTATYSATVRGSVYYKIAETTNDLRLTTSANEQGSWVVFAVRGAGSVTSSSANGTGADSNPPALTPAGGSKKYLWVATRSGDSTIVSTAAPTNFGGLVSIAASGTGGASTNVANYPFEGATLDPGVFTSANEQWVSFTLALWTDSFAGFPLTANIAVTTYTPTISSSLSASANPGVGSVAFSTYIPTVVGGTQTPVNITGFSLSSTAYAPSVPLPATVGISVPTAYIAASQPHITIDWVPPVENIDNSQLSNLAGYKVYYSQSAGNYGTPITVADPLATYALIRLPNSGTWFVQVSAYNSLAEESSLGSLITVSVPALSFAPDAHNGLTQVGGGNLSSAISTLTGTGVLRHNAYGAIQPIPLTLAGVGVVHLTGSGTFSVPPVVVVGAGVTSGYGSPNWFSRFTAYSGGQTNTWAARSFTSIVRAVNGTGAASPLPVTVSGLGKRGISDLGSPIDLYPADIGISGNGSGRLHLTGTGVLVAAQCTVVGTSHIRHVGTGALSSAAFTVSGSGKNKYTTTSALTAPAVIVYGRGSKNGAVVSPTFTGSGALSVPSVTVTGAGQKNKLGASIFGSGVLVNNRSPFVESFADLIPRLNLTVSAYLYGPQVFLDGTGDAHKTIVGTGSLSPVALSVNGNGFTPSTVYGIAHLTAPSVIVKGRGWGPATAPPEVWTIKSTTGETWTAVVTQSEQWNG
jgi:hypothetical protein